MKRLFLIIVSIISILSLLASCTANDAWQDDFYTTGTIYSWNGTAFVPLGTGGGGTNDHSALINLDYASAGHTGFEPAILYPGNPAQYLDGTGNFSIPAGGGGGNVTASANLGDNTVIRGDGGALGVQDSGVTIDDFDNLNTNGGDIDGFDINAGNDVNVTNDLDVTDDASIGGQLVVTGNISAQGNYVLTTDNVNDVPSNGNTTEPISSNWAYGHINEYATGSTFPASPWTGEMFLHSVTGRKILYSYSGTDWQPIISIGSMTVYVDSTDGTDDTSHGTAVDASAFKTVQYAVNTIPGMVGGNVIININGEAYAENVIIQGKNFTGNYNISIYGTLTAHATNAQESAVQGATTTFGSITDTGQFTGHANELLYSSNNAEYRIIDTVTADVGTIVQYWTAAPTGNYTIYQWATTIQKLTIEAGQLRVFVYDIYFLNTSSVPLTTYANSTPNFYRCKFSATTAWTLVSLVKSYAYFTDCLFTAAGYSLCCPGDGSVVYFQRCKFLDTGGTTLLLLVTAQSYARFDKACVFDGTTSTSNEGIVLYYSSFCNFDLTYSKIRNLHYGVNAQSGSEGLYSANNQYATNDTNENANATSFSYID